MAAYELLEKKPDLKVIVLESGRDIYHRVCPISAGKVDSRINCKPCSIMRGFGGAGAFSDGKYNFTTKFGGWLNEYLPDKKVMDLIHYVDDQYEAWCTGQGVQHGEKRSWQACAGA